MDELRTILTHAAAVIFGAGALHVIKLNLSFFQNWRNEEVQRVSKLLAGNWQATEKFADDRSQAEFEMTLFCNGTEVHGTQVCTKGRYDKSGVFDLSGSIRNQILTLTWWKKNSLETGTITARLMPDHKFIGCGLYVLPKTERVFPSEFSATKRQ